MCVLAPPLVLLFLYAGQGMKWKENQQKRIYMEFSSEYRHILFLYIFLYRKKERCAQAVHWCVHLRLLNRLLCMMFPLSLCISTCVKKRLSRCYFPPCWKGGGGRETFLLVRADGEPYSMLYTSRKMYIFLFLFLYSLFLFFVCGFLFHFSHRDVFFFFFLTSIGVQLYT